MKKLVKIHKIYGEIKISLVSVKSVHGNFGVHNLTFLLTKEVLV